MAKSKTELFYFYFPKYILIVMESTFISLSQLSEITGLPRATLRRMAEERKLPVLRLSRGLRFNPIQVQKALEHMAASEQSKADRE